MRSTPDGYMTEARKAQQLHLDAIYWQAYDAAQYARLGVPGWRDCPKEYDAEERKMWWAGTCGGNEDRRQA